MKKAIWIALGIAFLAGPGLGGEKRFQLSFSGGLDHVLEYGSEEDYQILENDFPVTPPHTPAAFGVSLAYFPVERLGIELAGRYTLSSKVSLVDPSDDDRVDVDTSMHYSFALNLLYHLAAGRFRPYILLGGGLDKVSGEEETYTSEYGYEITFLVPEKTLDPLVNAGAGVSYFFSRSAGVSLDIRTVFILADPDTVKSLNLSLVVFFRL